MSIGLSAQEKRVKNRFSRWQPWRHSLIFYQNNSSYFWSTSHPDVPIKIQINWPFGSGEERKIDFQAGSHNVYLEFWIGKILAFLDQHVIRCFLLSCKSVGLSVQEKKRKIYLQGGGYSGHLGFPIINEFSYFLSTSHPDSSYKVSSQLAFRFRRRSK